MFIFVLALALLVASAAVEATPCEGLASLEQGKRPEHITASHVTNGRVDKTRPLCPYGQVATYKGTGDTNDAASFSCVAEPRSTASR
jgi:hypothetical protein